MPLAKLLDADQSQIGFPPKTIEDGLIANRQFFSLKNIGNSITPETIALLLNEKFMRALPLW
jgi:hypothetical protein